MIERAGGLVVASTTIVFVAIPAGLFWYGAAHCEELGCVGPILQALIHAISVIPLLVTWAVTRRPKVAIILAVVELGFVIGMFISERDEFIPLAPLIALPIALVVGWIAALELERRPQKANHAHSETSSR